jgi:ABC-type nitrate/sulfonate/bicarbonate transport system substrate-binding protein
MKTKAWRRWKTGFMSWKTSWPIPAFQETMVKFVRASMKGWKYAEANPDEAAMIVLENDETGAQTEAHQKRMMGEWPS